MTPCFNLDTLYAPEASIWYHMAGGAMGTLAADVFDGTQWHLNVAGVVSGNQGSQWQEMRIDLREFAGETISIRFRGKTGDDFTSDISLDAFSLEETSGVSLNESAISGLTVYPNPSEGEFILENSTQQDKDLEVSITSVTGAQIMSLPFSENYGAGKMKIDLSAMPNGVYILTVTGTVQTKVVRLIKE